MLVIARLVVLPFFKERLRLSRPGDEVNVTTEFTRAKRPLVDYSFAWALDAPGVR